MNTADIDNLISILQSMKTNNKQDGIISEIENSETKKDINNFNLNDLKKYCKHYKINVDGIKSKYVNAVWKHIEDQYEWYYTDDSDEESDYESDDSE